MMGWKDKLLPASFRGVKFFVESHEYSSGRRAATHEYPFRDLSFTEDLGRQTRQLSLTAYLVGDDYMAKAQQLIDALEAEGPGELIHPYRGKFNVQIADRFTMSENKSEGGYCVFALPFQETSVKPILAVKANSKFKLNDYATKLSEAVRLDFIGKIITEGYPEFVTQYLGAETFELVDSIKGVVTGSGETLAALNLSSLNFKSTIGTLLGDPAALAFSMIGIMEQASDIIQSQGGSQSQMKSLTDSVISFSEPQTTPARLQSTENRQAAVDLVRQISVGERSRIISEETFTTYDDAIAARDGLAEDIEVLLDTASDEVAIALTDLRSEVVAAVPNEEVSLPRIRTVEVTTSIPSIVLAYTLYDDATRGDEIASRNVVPRPGFLPSRTPLNVLTNE